MPEHIAADEAQFQRILSRNIAVPLAAGVVSALLFIALIAYLLNALHWVEHTEHVISRVNESARLIAEEEAGMRGFALSGDERFLEPYEMATPRVKGELANLRTLLGDNTAQVDRVGRIEALHGEWLKFAVETIAARRVNGDYLQRITTGRGKRLMDGIRAEIDELTTVERRLLQDRNDRADSTTITLTIVYVIAMLLLTGLIAMFGRRDLKILSTTFGSALGEQRRQAEVLQAQAWLREGTSQLSARLATEQLQEPIAHAALEFLAGYTGMSVGAVYALAGREFRRIGSWAWQSEGAGAPELLPNDRTLLAECAAQRKQVVLEELPAGYLRVSSSLGTSDAASAILTPLMHEGRLAGVMEVGFLRPTTRRDAELLEQAGPVLGASVESARYRQQLQDTLEETQQLNEELQVQQEELRTANEELEEQSRALKESQANLESQQAELEQTNEQLSQLAQKLADQRDELQQAQQELGVRAADLQRASRYKSEFLANMSHELRTPLNSSLILARLLADNAKGNLDEEQVKFAESIYSAGNDLLNLINDILDIAKVEAGRLEIRPETVGPAQLLEGMRMMFAPLASNKGLAFEVQAMPGLPDTLWTDRQRLEQILRNLVGNALKFTERGGVTVVARPDGANVAFDVRDTGIGIAPDKQQAIFEAFQQADGTVSRRFGGTGLGLAISRDLARLLGGGIAVQSEPGQGSTFTVSVPAQYQAAAAPVVPAAAPAALPAAPAPAAATKAGPPAPARAPAPLPFRDDRESAREARRSVLVIEDDTAFAHILLDLAHELGYHCVVAQNADEGVRLAQQVRPDAVLLDMRLPDGTGLSVLQRLKDDPGTRHIPVHAMSVEDLAETALQMGAVGYMFKPSSQDELREMFGRLADRLDRKVKRVLLVEDDERQRDSVRALIADEDVEIVSAGTGAEALQALADAVFDCMIIDLKLPDMNGQELLRRMAAGESRSFPPVIVYTGRNLTRDEEAELLRYSRSIIIKGARSPERLLDEVTLFLHKVETRLSTERQRMLRVARSRDRAFEGRRILVADDDVRNIFALTSALEQKGASVVVARNGLEAIEKLEKNEDIDLVLMDIMMPEMDGYSAMREIRNQPRWKKLPIIAVTAKAMREDQERCLKAGANDYLAKPIDLERLFSLMRVWMPKLERI